MDDSQQDLPYDLHASPGVPIKAWTRGVPVEHGALVQLRKTAMLPFVHGWVAVMPDVHIGIGATVGSVIPTKGAIVPAAVGVDLGCGMIATRTTLTSHDLPTGLAELRTAIEKAVPHGRSDNGGKNDKGAWRTLPGGVENVWRDELAPRWKAIVDKHKTLGRGARGRARSRRRNVCLGRVYAEVKETSMRHSSSMSVLLSVHQPAEPPRLQVGDIDTARHEWLGVATLHWHDAEHEVAALGPLGTSLAGERVRSLTSRAFAASEQDAMRLALEGVLFQLTALEEARRERR